MQKCMICGMPDFDFVHELRDDDGRQVYKCKKCGHIQIQPLPTAEEDYEFYQTTEMYAGMFDNKDNIKNIDKIADRARSFAEYQNKKLIPFLHADWKILEIGCAFGWLVEYMQNRGYDFNGVEISEAYREAYYRRTGKKLYGFNLLFDDEDTSLHFQKYDCIVMFHTLEHISDPITFLKRAGRLLKDGGAVYIEVPNNNDWMMHFSEEYTAFHYVRGHVSYYTPESLRMVLNQSGFKNIDIHGNQIYSVENVLQWLRYGKPFLEYHQIDVPEPIRWINELYKERIESDLKSFAIVGIGEK